MIGPGDTSFAGGLFYLKIEFPKNYPYSGPEVRFVTPIYHVNVNHIAQPGCPLGHICLSTLNFWNQEYRMRVVLTNIFALFYLGNAESPYGIDRQSEMLHTPDLFEKKIFPEIFSRKIFGFTEILLSWVFSLPDFLLSCGFAAVMKHKARFHEPALHKHIMVRHRDHGHPLSAGGSQLFFCPAQCRLRDPARILFRIGIKSHDPEVLGNCRSPAEGIRQRRFLF